MTMDEVKKILVPVGFDAFTEKELEIAANIAKRYDAEVHILHVYQDVFSVLSMRTLDLDRAAVEEKIHSSVEEKLHQLVAEVRMDSPAKAVAIKGEIVDSIIEYVKNEQIDLVVLATHGRAGISHFFLGSVAENVIRFSPCPVLTFRTPPKKD
ncbi:MAG: hypothetical protein CL946_12650 [Ectothiorhodospiraceae bacterium]|nr:hypothetical protein [Ectothiorhodospiraceae bacterium]